MWATQTNEVSVHASVKEREENVQCVAGTHNLGEGTVEAAAFLRLFSTGDKLLHPLNVAQLHRNQGGGTTTSGGSWKERGANMTVP